MNRQRDTVIFDLGGVLIDWNPKQLYKKIFNGDEARTEWFLSNICTNEWNQNHDLGVPFDENAKTLIQKFPEYEKEIRAYKDRWGEMLGGPIHETVEIVSNLKKEGRPIYALTNWSAETFPRARKTFSFLSWFDGIVVSGEIGIKKPDPQIFHHLFETYKVEPTRAVFIDDAIVNIEAANKLGVHGILYKNPAELRKELSAILIPQQEANPKR